MKTEILIDCQSIADDNDFYAQFAAQLQLDDHFGANLDALWDVLTTDLPLPIRIKFINFQSAVHAEALDKVIQVIREAQIELQGSLKLEFNADQATVHLRHKK